jgi:hypothetical protein
MQYAICVRAGPRLGGWLVGVGVRVGVGVGVGVFDRCLGLFQLLCCGVHCSLSSRAPYITLSYVLYVYISVRVQVACGVWIFNI